MSNLPQPPRNQAHASGPVSQDSVLLRSFSDDHDSHVPKIAGKTITLSRMEAAEWLDCIGRCLPSAGPLREDLEALRTAVEDACWLARWKREQVLVQVDAGGLASILEALLQISQQETCTELLCLIERTLDGAARG